MFVSVVEAAASPSPTAVAVLTWRVARSRRGLFLPLGPVPLGVSLHLLEPRVVVGELLQVCERDLPRDDRIVVGDIRLRVMRPVLELDVHPRSELLELEARPVDADRVADPLRLFACRPPGLGHVAPPRSARYGSAYSPRVANTSARFAPASVTADLARRWRTAAMIRDRRRSFDERLRGRATTRDPAAGPLDSGPPPLRDRRLRRERVRCRRGRRRDQRAHRDVVRARGALPGRRRARRVHP